MGLLRTLSTHHDATLAGVLTVAYLAEVATRGAPAAEPLLAQLGAATELAIVLGALFTASLVVRRRLPVMVLVFGFVAVLASGRQPVDGSWAILAAIVVTTWSVGAFSDGPSALVGALGVGLLTGLLVVRDPGDAVRMRDVAIAMLLVPGPWLAGVVSRGRWWWRRDDDDLVPTFEDWHEEGGIFQAGDALTDDTADVARALYESGAHALSNVAAQARGARRTAFDDPDLADRVLAGVEFAASQALLELRRLAATLPPMDAPTALGSGAGLGDLEALADEVGEAGVPVDLRIEGAPSALSPALDQVAYDVVADALGNTLEHAGPARASVVVRFRPDELQLDIEDDGPGVDDDRDDDHEHAALRAIAERVSLHGGVLEAGPGRRGGYRVSVRLPLPG